MPELTDQSTTSWAHVLGANLPASVESLRCVEWETPEGLNVSVRYATDAFEATITSSGPGLGGVGRYRTIVGLLKDYLPPTDEKLSALHRLRLSATAPVDFGDPQPATAPRYWTGAP